jgi:hypothetical protein
VHSPPNGKQLGLLFGRSSSSLRFVNPFLRLKVMIPNGHSAHCVLIETVATNEATPTQVATFRKCLLPDISRDPPFRTILKLCLCTYKVRRSRKLARLKATLAAMLDRDPSDASLDMRSGNTQGNALGVRVTTPVEILGRGQSRAGPALPRRMASPARRAGQVGASSLSTVDASGGTEPAAQVEARRGQPPGDRRSDVTDTVGPILDQLALIHRVVNYQATAADMRLFEHDLHHDLQFHTVINTRIQLYKAERLPEKAWRLKTVVEQIPIDMDLLARPRPDTISLRMRMQNFTLAGESGGTSRSSGQCPGRHCCRIS